MINIVGCVGKVVESKNKQFAVGDYVLGMKGWREYWISDGNPAGGISKIDPNIGPIQVFLGIFGMTGLTAYVGLLRIGQLKEGETVFVSAASHRYQPCFGKFLTTLTSGTKSRM